MAGVLFTVCFAPLQGKNNHHLPDYKVVSDWDCIKKKEGITLCERWIELNSHLKVRERKGIMVVDCNMKEAEKYLNQANTIKEWMSGVSEIETIKQPLTRTDLVHIVLGLPWPFENRDVVGKYEVEELDDKHEVVRIYSVDGIKPSEDKVRIKKYCASWTLEAIEENKTKVVFDTFSDEPPMFPLWIQDPVVKKIYYNNLESLKEHLSAL